MNVLFTKMNTVSAQAEVCGCLTSLLCLDLRLHPATFMLFELGQAVSPGGLEIHMLGKNSPSCKWGQKGPTSSAENLVNGMMKTLLGGKKNQTNTIN